MRLLEEGDEITGFMGFSSKTTHSRGPSCVFDMYEFIFSLSLQ